jgi:hypothetical protein
VDGATLIRDARTGCYLAEGLEWTDDRARAVVFADAETAGRFVDRHACERGHLEVIGRPEPAAA